MKRFVFGTLMMFFLVLISCNTSPKEAEEVDKASLETVAIIVPVEGMTCGGCENTVNTQLLKLDGVVESHASHLDKNVVVIIDTNVTKINEVKAEIEKVGYSVLK